MVFGAAIAIVCAGQSDAVFQRMRTFLTSASSYEADYTVTINDEPPVPSAWKWQKQRDQIYSFKIPNAHYELRQHADASMIIEHGEKNYQEYRRFSDGYLFPDPDANMPATLGYPYLILLLTDPRLPSSVFTLEVRDGKNWLVGAVGGLAGPEKVEILSDEQGRPQVIKRLIETDEGPLNITMKFNSFKSASQLFAPPSMMPMSGYVPVSETIFNTVYPGDPVVWNDWRDKSGAMRKMKDSLKGKGLVIFLTAPECEVSQRSAKDFKVLREKLQKAGWSVVELSLGGGAPVGFSGAELFQDVGERIEREWAISSTPYFVSIQPDGKFRGAYDGWHSKSPDEAFRGLTETAEEANP